MDNGASELYIGHHTLYKAGQFWTVSDVEYFSPNSPSRSMETSPERDFIPVPKLNDTFSLGATRFLIEVKAPDQIDPARGLGPLLTLHEPHLTTYPDHESEVRNMLGLAHARKARRTVFARGEVLRTGAMEDVDPGEMAGKLYTSCGHGVLSEHIYTQENQPDPLSLSHVWSMLIEGIKGWATEDSCPVMTIRCRTQGIDIKLLLQALALSIPFQNINLLVRILVDKPSLKSYLRYRLEEAHEDWTQEVHMHTGFVRMPELPASLVRLNHIAKKVRELTQAIREGRLTLFQAYLEMATLSQDPIDMERILVKIPNGTDLATRWREYLPERQLKEACRWDRERILIDQNRQELAESEREEYQQLQDSKN